MCLPRDALPLRPHSPLASSTKKSQDLLARRPPVGRGAAGRPDPKRAGGLGSRPRSPMPPTSAHVARAASKAVLRLICGHRPLPGRHAQPGGALPCPRGERFRAPRHVWSRLMLRWMVCSRGGRGKELEGCMRVGTSLRLPLVRVTQRVLALSFLEFRTVS